MYDRKAYATVSERFKVKRKKANADADQRLNEVYKNIPSVMLIDAELSSTAWKLMQTGKAYDVRKWNEKLTKQRNDLLTEKGYPEDYTDITYECDKCQDTGYKGNFEMCECFKAELTKEMLNASGIKELIETQRFDNFSFKYYDSEEVKTNYAVLKEFSENFVSGNSFILVGGTGLGKTHLSSAVAGEVIKRGHSVTYVTAKDLVGDFEHNRFDKGNNNTQKYTSTELLIIDDLGTESVNQFTCACLYDVINTRLNKRLSTIINTNLNAKEIREKYWDRIASRIFGEYTPLVFTGKDIRMQKLRGEKL